MTRALSRALALALSCCTAACPAEEVPCEDALQITRDNTSGLEVCGDDVNRVDEVTCGPVFQVDTCDALTCTGPSCHCTVDADCGDTGICEQQNEGCACFDPCQRDADCDSSEVCVCSAVVGAKGGDDGSVLLQHPVCVEADCKTGDDCASGKCGVTFTTVCPRPERLVCRDDAKDACGISGKTCDDDEQCVSDDAGPFTCAGIATCE